MQTVSKVNNVENIELVVSDINKTRFNFFDIENLRGKRIKQIDIPQVGKLSVTPTGKAVVNDTVYKKAYLVLSVDGNEKINRLPLLALNPYEVGGNRIELADLNVNWPKSYIEVGSLDGLVLNEAFLLTVYF